ncbi:MAG TPA: tetratricopeptide repeat protein [Devosia sp.]|nr:tetratricopeptide repeat protein [Devosia sp.]
MRISRGASALFSIAMVSALLVAAPAIAQDGGTHAPAAPAVPAEQAPPTAMDAAQAMAAAMDGAGGGISSAEQIAALQDAAAAGDPMAQWQLGLMYESGEGVEQDKAKAFGYFAQIADQHADTAPRGVEADIVAHSFVKIGEYYKDGLPEAGVAKDEDYSIKLLMHAASYFGDPDAQYRLGEAYLDKNELGDNPVQSARWFSLAAKKGHVGAQAKLGDILFNGDTGLKANRVEGLMWLTVASRRSTGTTDADWINDLLNGDMSVATPDERKQAMDMADGLAAQFAGL